MACPHGTARCWARTIRNGRELTAAERARGSADLVNHYHKDDSSFVSGNGSAPDHLCCFFSHIFLRCRAFYHCPHRNCKLSKYSVIPTQIIQCRICYVYMCISLLTDAIVHVCVSTEWRRLTGGSVVQLASSWMRAPRRTKCSNKCCF